MRIALVACLCGLFATAQAQAKPLHYQLDPTASVVGFTITMGQSAMKGKMPVSAADLTLDFARATDSSVKVILDVAAAQMGLPFATQAMQSPSVLDTEAFPQITFTSTKLRANGDMATVEGKITIRNVTRPITLAAQLFRPQGSPEGARDRLSIHLTGTLNRSDFGATGYGDLVGDVVHLDIVAHIRRDGAA